MNQIQHFNYRPRQVYKDGFTSFDGIAYTIAFVILVILGIWVLQQATDRICTKQFSESFKKTATYQQMKCNQ